MKKTLFALLVVGAVALAGPRQASAQTDPALVKIPFQFIVGQTVMAAGSYRITSDEQDGTVLMITPLDGKAGAVFASTEWAGSSTAGDQQAHVQFKNVDGHYFLWQVAMPGAGTRAVKFTKAQAERTLARLNLVPAEHADGAK